MPMFSVTIILELISFNFSAEPSFNCVRTEGSLELAERIVRICFIKSVLQSIMLAGTNLVDITEVKL